MKSKDFLSEGFIEDASDVHMDHEVQMAREECYHAAEHALAIHKLLRNISEQQGLEGWVSSKITLANDYLNTVREHLEYELLQPKADDLALGMPIAENEQQGVAESMKGQVVFSGSGADGGKYEIIQTGPTDFMIHANGKHIDTYSSLQRAMGVLKNEVSGLKKGVAEGVLDFFEKKPMPEHGDELKIGDRYVIFNDGGSYYGVSWIKQDRSEAYEEFNKSEYTDLNQLKKAIWDEIKYQDQRGVAEGSLNEGQYEMMMRNGQVKKFIAKDDADAKRIAAGHGAKSVIRLKGGVPAGKVAEQGMAEGLPGSLSKSDYTSGKTLKHTSSNCTACHGRKTMYKLDGKLYADNKAGATKVKCPTCKGTGDKQGVAEGKKSDRYHIVDKDGKPASLASYADKASALKDRDEKYPGAVVQQVGPRGKVKGVAEAAKCNHTMEGENCPVHGLKECPSMKARALAEWRKAERAKRQIDTVNETTAGSVAGVVNAPIKNKAKVGSLFGGTYQQPKKAKKA